MSETPLHTQEPRAVVPDEPLIVEDLLCQIEVLVVTNGDPATIADLWAQVDLLEAR